MHDFLNTRCLTVAGGTEQILLTLACERLPGLLLLDYFKVNRMRNGACADSESQDLATAPLTGRPRRLKGCGGSELDRPGYELSQPLCSRRCSTKAC